MKQTIKRSTLFRKYQTVLFVILMISMMSMDGMTQDIWEPANGPFGGSVYAITNSPNGTVYAGTQYGGVFKSTNKGVSWQPTVMGSAVYSLLAVSDSMIFAGSYSSSMYRTTDAWETYELKKNGLPNSSVRSMGYSTVGYIFAATGEGIFRTGDYGDKWVAVNSGLSDLNVNILFVTSENVLYAGTQTGGLFRSASSGESWDQLDQSNNGIPVASVSGLAEDLDGGIYAGVGSNNGVYVSIDGGSSWSNIGLTNRSIRSLAVNSGGVLFAGTWQSGLRYSLDGGGTWKVADLGFAPLNVQTVHVDPLTDDVYAGCIWYYGGGIYHSGNDGASWEPRNEGLAGTRIWKMAVNPATGTVFAGDYYNGLYRSRDMGMSWEPLGNGMSELQSSFIRGLAVHPSGAIFSGSGGGGLHRSMTDGDDWMRVYGKPGAYVFIDAVAVREDGAVFLGVNSTDSSIFKSINEGETWENITNGMNGKTITCIVFNNLQHIYIGTRSNGVYRSTNDGVTWSPVGSDLSTYEIFDIAINSKDDVFATVTGQGVFKTTDNSTWAQVGAGVLGTTNHPIEINRKDHIFVGLSNLWVSKDDGTTWLNYDTGLNSYEINDLAFDMEERLYAGTYHGVFSTLEPTTAVTMRFTVKMKYEDGFDPSTQTVAVRGPFNNWGVDGDWLLEGQEDVDLTYMGTFSVINPVDFMRNDTLEYKYAMPNGAGTDDDVWELFDGYRLTIWDGNNDLSLEPVWFSNQKEFTRITTSGLIGESTDSRGISWADIDNDGNEDLIITESGTTSRNDVYINNGDGKFNKLTSGPVGLDNGDSRAAVWGDYNNDGHIDLFVANLGQENFLYKNDGAGNFTRDLDVVIKNETGNSVGAVWVDFDNDGWLDLFVANSGGENNFLFMNQGDGSFAKITGLDIVSDGGDSRGCAAADFNNDGFLDLFVANAATGGEKNFLYLNNRSGGFTRITLGPVVEDKAESSGGSWGDYNNDGWLDLYVTNRFGQPNRLYKNDGKGDFIAIESSQVPDVPLSSSRGSAWADYDNDGWLDLYVTNFGEQENMFFRNKADGGFEQQSLGPLVQDIERDSRGAAWADYDNDGDADLVVANDGGVNALYRNNLDVSNWLKIRLVGTVSNTSAIGATVVVKTELTKEDNSELIQRRSVEGQSGFLGQSSQTLLFGLRQETVVDSITIYWPSGIVNRYDTKPVNQVMLFTEFEPTALPPKVILNAPQDQSTDISLPPGLAWNEAPGATNYHLQVATDIGFSNILVNEDTITNTVFTITNALNITTYYWRVQAGNGSDWGEWSGTWKFTTGSSTVTLPPPAPNLSSPVNKATNISIPPILSWNAVGGALKYWFQVSESSDFSTLMMAQDSNNAFTNYTTGGGSYNTLYYWRVKAKNEAGWGPWSNVWSFTTEPLTGLPDPPTLAGPVDGQTGVPIPAPLVWNSAAAGSYVVEIATDLSFSNIVFSRSDNPERYLFANGLNHNQQYYWRVRIIVSGTNSDWSNVWSFTTYTDKIEINNVTVPFPSHERKDEFSVSDYRMMGLPGNADIAFRDILGDGAKENWMAYWDNGKSGTPDVYLFSYDGSGIFRFVTGKGFWIIHNGSININQSIPNAPLNELAQAEISIHQGWNIITCPFGHSISWSAVKFVNNITAASPIFSYNSSTHSFDLSDKLDPVQGFYLYNNNPARTTLLVPFIDGSGKVSAQSDLSWEVTLELSSGETIDASAKIGVAADAENGLDRYEYRKPRGIANLANIYFDRSEWDADYGIFANDIRPEIDGMETWDFKVYASVNEASKFSLIGLETIPEAYEVYLVDRTHQRYQNLRKNDVYEFNSTPQISDFELVVGEADVVEEKIQSILPAEYTLGQNYPNPFNPTTTIPLTLPEQSDITLKVYNLLGQEIVTIFKGNLNAGKHYIIWNGANQVNQRMPSGVYMYQLLTEKGRRFTGKMVLIK